MLALMWDAEKKAWENDVYAKNDFEEFESAPTEVKSAEVQYCKR